MSTLHQLILVASPWFSLAVVVILFAVAFRLSWRTLKTRKGARSSWGVLWTEFYDPDRHVVVVLQEGVRYEGRVSSTGPMLQSRALLLDDVTMYSAAHPDGRELDGVCFNDDKPFTVLLVDSRDRRSLPALSSTSGV